MKSKRETWGIDPRYERITYFRPDGEVDHVVLQPRQGCTLATTVTSRTAASRRLKWLLLVLILLSVLGALSGTWAAAFGFSAEPEKSPKAGTHRTPAGASSPAMLHVLSADPWWVGGCSQGEGSRLQGLSPGFCAAIRGKGVKS